MWPNKPIREWSWTDWRYVISVYVFGSLAMLIALLIALSFRIPHHG